MVSKLKNWEGVVQKFLKTWDKRDKVIAALVCGSYVTGNPSKHSDIDLHLVLSDDVTWRERGNKIIDGMLIEYFSNPEKQIESYFKDDYEDGNYASPTQFLTGKIIFDKTGVITRLKNLAQSYKDKELQKMNLVVSEIKKYGLWDNLDNLQDSYEKNSLDFYYVYYNALQDAYVIYSKYLQYPASGASKSYDTLTSEVSRKKYLLEKFPDNKFVALFKKAIVLKEKSKMMKDFESLSNHVFRQMGGFKIDGWKANSPLDIHKTKV